MAAPALAASIADWAICSGVTGTAGLRPGVSAEPVTAHEIMTLRCITVLRGGGPSACFAAKPSAGTGRSPGLRRGGMDQTPRVRFAARSWQVRTWMTRGLPRIVHCAKAPAPVLGTDPICRNFASDYGPLAAGLGGVFRTAPEHRR